MKISISNINFQPTAIISVNNMSDVGHLMPIADPEYVENIVYMICISAHAEIVYSFEIHVRTLDIVCSLVTSDIDMIKICLF